MHPFFRYWDEFGRSNPRILENLFQVEFVSAVDDELNWLFREYSAIPRYGRAHPSPCAVWRSERNLHFHEDDWDARFANRIHIFDGTGGRCETISSVAAQTGPPKPDQRYMGFVSLRPHRYSRLSEKDRGGRGFHLRYTALALLVPPPKMQRPRFHIITCAAGPSEGVLPFRTTPFCSPPAALVEPAKLSGQQGRSVPNHAPCMHAAMHAALLLKTDAYLCRPISSQDMVALVWQLDHARAINGTREAASISEWNHNGLSLDDALSVLRDVQVRGGGVLEHIIDPGPYCPNGNPSSDDPTRPALTPDERKEMVCLEALRCITDYVANGCRFCSR